VPLKANADEALNTAGDVVKTVLVVRAPAAPSTMSAGRDVWYDEAMARSPPTARPSR
jgi:acetyl-CoA synthetase